MSCASKDIFENVPCLMYGHSSRHRFGKSWDDISRMEHNFSMKQNISKPVPQMTYFEKLSFLAEVAFKGHSFAKI